MMAEIHVPEAWHLKQLSPAEEKVVEPPPNNSLMLPTNTTALVMAALTAAERLVAIHVVRGFSNKEIAAILGKAESTVKHQVSSILRAAKVQSRCQFIALYYQQFFCPLPFAVSRTTGFRRQSLFSAPDHGTNCL